MSDQDSYNPIHRFIEIAAIAAYIAILIAGTYRIAMLDIWSEPTTFLWAFSAIFMGLVCADFVSGFVHWLADSFGHVDMFILGDAFIRPFREHHVDPKNITTHDFVEVNGNNCVTILLFLPFVAAVHHFVAPGVKLWIEGWTIAFTFAIFFTNQIHSWAHADNPPALVRRLQSINLILSPHHHDVHHTSPHDRNFCITLGWMNPVLERIDFFGRLYRFVRRRQGIAVVEPQPFARPATE